MQRVPMLTDKKKDDVEWNMCFPLWHHEQRCRAAAPAASFVLNK